MQYRRLHRSFTPDAIANIRRRYEDTDEPQDSIAADFGVHRKTLNRLAHDQGWILRKDRGPRDLPADLRLTIEAEQAVSGEGDSGPEGPPLSVTDRLERAVEKQLAVVEQMRVALALEPSSLADAERAARIIERLTEALFKIRRLRLPGAATASQDNEIDLPKDIDEFRHALARRIEAFVRSHADDAVPGVGASDSADPPC